MRQQMYATAECITDILASSPRLSSLILMHPDLSTADLTQQLRHTGITKLKVQLDSDKVNSHKLPQLLDLPALSKVALASTSEDSTCCVQFLQGISTTRPELVRLDIRNISPAHLQSMFD